ncbi:hypothetical protein L7F22_015545 [Adiantum nelumboides]|nr:hypothetical protein [Adiantum nelumboides]
MAYMRVRCCTSFVTRLQWLRSGAPSFGFSTSEEERSSIKERGPYASRLKSRGVVLLEGEDTFHFLQGLVSNDLRRLQQEPPPSEAALPTPNQPVALAQPLYATLLNPQGRFLFDAFLYRSPNPTHRLDPSGSAPGNDGSVSLLCEVDAATIDDFLGHLKKHRLRTKVNFEDVSKELVVWQRYGGSLLQDNQENKDAETKSSGWGAASDPAAQAALEGTNKGYAWFKDPRCGDLGYRGVFSSDTNPPLVEAGKEVEEIYYLLMRLELGVAEGCSEIPKEKAIPLEYNLAWLNAISFDKGCYVGQELIARTQHRGVIRKRVMPIRFINDSGEDVKHDVVPGAEILDSTTQKKVGDITTVLGSRGLGLIRLEAVLKNAAPLIVKDRSGVHVQAYRPKWWPADWCPEDLQHS